MKEIKLTKGLVAIVDDADYEWLSKWKWSTSGASQNKYATRCVSVNGKRSNIKMHKEILNVDPGMEVDHKDGNSLNNQRSNLRVATRSQNMMNRKMQTNNTSGHRGVFVNPKSTTRPWRAAIRFNGRLIWLRTHKTKEEAAKAYQEAAKRLFGEFYRETP
jgi:hypothetical protein